MKNFGFVIVVVVLVVSFAVREYAHQKEVSRLKFELSSADVRLEKINEKFASVTRQIKVAEMTLESLETQRDAFQEQAKNNFLDLQDEKLWHADRLCELEQYKKHLFEVETRLIKAGYKISDDPKWPAHFIPNVRIGKTNAHLDPILGPSGEPPVTGKKQ